MASQNVGKLDLIIGLTRARNQVEKLNRDLQTCLSFGGRKNAIICAKQLCDAILHLDQVEEQSAAARRQMEIEAIAEEAAQQFELCLPAGGVALNGGRS